MSLNYIDIDEVLGGETSTSNNDGLNDYLHQLTKDIHKLKKNQRRIKKKGGKGHKWKKIKKKIKSLEKRQDKIIEFLDIAAHQWGKNSFSETLIASTPKLIELGTEIAKGFNNRNK